VRLDERVGLGDRAIDVGLGGEVHDRVAALHRRRDRVGVLDARVHEAVAGAAGDVGEVLLPPGVGELVEDDDLVAVLGDALADEVRADEAGPAADEQLHWRTSDRR
jgi:hypothetical protein